MSEVHSQLEELARKAGAKIIGLTLKTEQKVNKKSRLNGSPCPWSVVHKISDRTAILGCRYGSCVNRALERSGEEPDFTPGSLWNGAGQFVNESPCFVTHKEHGGVYVAVMLLSTRNERFEDVNGRTITKLELEEFLPPVKENGLVCWRTIHVSSILEVRYGESI